MELVLGFTIFLAAALVITVALTGSTFRDAISGHADTSKLHQQPGA